MSSYIDKITTNVFDILFKELKKTENQVKIKTYVLDPAICYMLDKIYPYIFITCAIFIIFITIFLYLLYLIFKMNK
jgi:hypothetical protein